jgi:hypothetical protein
MTHLNMKSHGQKNVIFGNCIAITVRFQCDCAGGEVVTISSLVDRDAPKGRLEAAVQLMIQDLNYEIEQHMKRQKV